VLIETIVASRSSLKVVGRRGPFRTAAMLPLSKILVSLGRSHPH
jgi:hypothetical protein